jgi:hypothetical protein
LGKFIDITGQRFGKLIVLEKAERPQGYTNKSLYWLCQCDCGKQKIVSSSALHSGHVKSCGCLNHKFPDLTGRTFNRWTVIKETEDVHERKTGAKYFLCKCDCGTEKVVNGNSLIRGRSKSCGCLQKEITHDLLVKDLTGKRFSRLEVIELDYIKENRAYWKCKCDCGTIKTIASSTLQSGFTKSCGCLAKETIGNLRRIDYGEAAFNAVYGRYKARAKTKNVDFSLSKIDFLNITQSKCFYCNCEPNQIYRGEAVRNGEYVYNGIDRIDSTKGYTLDNTVTCCWMCNRSKGADTLEYFYQWVDNAYNNIHKNILKDL